MPDLGLPNLDGVAIEFRTAFRENAVVLFGLECHKIGRAAFVRLVGLVAESKRIGTRYLVPEGARSPTTASRYDTPEMGLTPKTP